LWETGNGLEGAFTYSSELFDEATIIGISERFTKVLEIVTTGGDTRLSVLRAQIDEVGRAYRQRVTRGLEEVSHQKLRSAKRKAVSD
jgi:hypothetical protein